MNDILLSNNGIFRCELNWKTMLDLRWDEECGIICLYQVRGKLIRTENGKVAYVK